MNTIATLRLLPVNTRPTRFNFRERGYVLLVMLLMVTLLSLALLAAIEQIGFQVKRDREEELIHRGVQYSRAVRRFVKKFGRYPESIDELENTSNFRALRRRYKDPITGKDFKVLHTADLYSGNENSPGVAVASLTSRQSGAQRTRGASDAMQNSANPRDTSQPDQNSNSEADQSVSIGSAVAAPQPLSSFAGSNGQPVVIGPMVGVASTSKEKSIREFNKQNHYNQWKFTYNPTQDVRLVSTPDQPVLQGAIQSNQEGDQNLKPNSGANPGQQASSAPASDAPPSQ